MHEPTLEIKKILFSTRKIFPYDHLFILPFKRVYSIDEESLSLVSMQYRGLRYQLPVRQPLLPHVPPFHTRQLLSSGTSDDLDQSRFALCRSEDLQRLFACFSRGTIPICLGSPKHLQEIPSDCYIRIDEVESWDISRLHQHLNSIDPTTCQNYLDNIKKFINGPGSYPFSKELFQVTFLETIRVS